MKRLSRVSVPLAAVAAVLLGVLGPASPASAQPVQVHQFATTSHPYSDPVWFPLATSSLMNCMWNNPGCPASQVQPYWGWDINAPHEAAGQFHHKVYAMGAGIVHILADNQGCGGPDEERGNVLYINHGGGVISMYSHLANHFLVHDGDYVSARTPIGYVGNSGYKSCNQKPNVRFLAVVVKNDARRAPGGGMTGNYTQVTHTYACVHGHRVDWPQHLPGHHGKGWTRWHHVPLGTAIPATSGQRSCIPAPNTSTEPHDATLHRASRSGLSAKWSSPAGRYGVDTVRVMLEEYHPSISKWLPVHVHTPSGDATRTYFAHLDVHHKFRMKIWFENKVGWSRPSPWRQRNLATYPH